jgi:hypothetical protein
MMFRPSAAAFLAATIMTGSAFAQTPQPFPRPGEPSRPQPSSPPPAKPPARPPDTQGLKVLPPEPAAPPTQKTGEPNEQTLGFPIYPGAQFIDSFDAGRGQRYYLFGINTDFAQIVAYYRTTLKQRGELVFEMPPIHMFEVGRFREETMAFPPGVTVKDYSPDGYLHPKRGGEPARYRTIIQIVPVPPPAAPAK